MVKLTNSVKGLHMCYLDIDFPEQNNDPAQKESNELYRKLNDPSKWIYGCEVRDHVLSQPENFPFYAHLTRKVFMHYAGERYNPHTIPMIREIHMRHLVKLVIEYKVNGKVKGYDWELLNVYFPAEINALLGLDIPYDKDRLEEGLRPEFKSPFHGLNDVNA